MVPVTGSGFKASEGVVMGSDGLTLARSAAALTHWSDPSSYNLGWIQRARFAARMIQPNDWVCDLGCGPQALRWFLPRRGEFKQSGAIPDQSKCNGDSNHKVHRHIDPGSFGTTKCDN